MTSPGATPVAKRPGSRIAMLLTVGAAATSSWTGFRLNGFNLSDYFLALAAGFWLIALVVRHKPVTVPPWATVPPLAFALLAAGGAILYDIPLIGQRAAPLWVVGEAAADAYAGPLLLIGRMLLALTIVAFVVVSAATDADDAPARMKLLVYAVAFGAAVSALDAVLQQTISFPDLPFQYHIVSARASGFANHPNSLGQSLALAMPIILHATVHARRHRLRLASLAALGLLTVGIYLSGSRASLAMGALVLLSGAVIAMRNTRWPLVALPVAPLLVAAGLLALPSLIASTRFADIDASVSTSARWSALKTGWGIFTESPFFGSGVASWVGEMVPLILLTSGGIALFLTFYLCLTVPLRRGLGIPKRASALARTLVVVGVAVLAFGFLNNAIAERYLYWSFAALYVLAQAQQPQAPSYPTRRARPHRAKSSTHIAASDPMASPPRAAQAP